MSDPTKEIIDKAKADWEKIKPLVDAADRFMGGHKKVRVVKDVHGKLRALPIEEKEND